MQPDPPESRPPRGRPPRKPRGKRAELQRWLERERPSRIGEREWAAVLEELKPSPESYVRRLVRECGVPLEPLVEGVRQEGFDALEKSLVALQEQYQSGDAARRKRARALVIQAKDHARWAARRSQQGAIKEEMILWMRTWLENPPLFAGWVRLRKGRAGV